MRESEIRRLIQGAALAATVAVASAAAPTVAVAQAGGDAGMAQTTTMNDDLDDDGMDWGWLGLLGLAGLFGLRRRDDHVHHTDTTTRRPMT